MATSSPAHKVPVLSPRPTTVSLEGASITPHYVFNDASDVAQDNPLDARNIALGDSADVIDSEHGHCVRVPVPAGAKYLVIAHAWCIMASPGSDTDPTTLPVVRVFGCLPSFAPLSGAGTPFAAASTNSIQIPGNLSPNAMPPLVTHTEDWTALSNLNTGEYTFTLGSVSAPVAVWETEDAGGNLYRRSATKTIHLRGCTDILISVATASVGPSSGAIIGTFEF